MDKEPKGYYDWILWKLEQEKKRMDEKAKVPEYLTGKGKLTVKDLEEASDYTSFDLTINRVDDPTTLSNDDITLDENQPYIKDNICIFHNGIVVNYQKILQS